MWFTRKPPMDPKLLLEGARFLAESAGTRATIHEWQIGLRARLLLKGHPADQVERVIEHLLK